MPARVHLTIAVFVRLLHPDPTAGIPVRFDPFPEPGQGDLLPRGAAGRECKLLVRATITVGRREAFTSLGFALGLASEHFR